MARSFADVALAWLMLLAADFTASKVEGGWGRTAVM
jgi:hypothetical protein